MTPKIIVVIGDRSIQRVPEIADPDSTNYVFQINCTKEIDNSTFPEIPIEKITIKDFKSLSSLKDYQSVVLFDKMGLVLDNYLIECLAKSNGDSVCPYMSMSAKLATKE